MKRLFAAAVLLLFALIVRPASAVTVWYQPTPFPANVNATIPESQRHFTEGWVLVGSNSVPIQQNGTTLQQSSYLYVGGFLVGYRFLSFLKFDLTGLPQHVDNAFLWLDAAGLNSPWVYSPYAVCSVLSSWNGISNWSALPRNGQCVGWYASPTAGNWSGFWMRYPGYLDWYNQWQNGTLANNGVLLYSQQYGGYVLDPFVSSQYSADGARPLIQLTFTPPVAVPVFRMPLPGGASWQLTNEVGGYECKGIQPWPDAAHQGSNYFSIDIAQANHDSNGSTVFTGNIPVIAASNGVVVFAGTDSPEVGNGNYVVINHNNDITNATGFSTRYLHLQENLQVHAGSLVTTGQLLGYMGQTGAAFGVHLHFGIRYATTQQTSVPAQKRGDGSASSNVQYVVMEGKLLKSYQTECGLNPQGVQSWIRYYPSNNVGVGVYPVRN